MDAATEGTQKKFDMDSAIKEVRDAVLAGVHRHVEVRRQQRDQVTAAFLRWLADAAKCAVFRSGDESVVVRLPIDVSVIASMVPVVESEELKDEIRSILPDVEARLSNDENEFLLSIENEKTLRVRVLPVKPLVPCAPKRPRSTRDGQGEGAEKPRYLDFSDDE